MAIGELQSVYALLYTNEAARERFESDPEGFARAQGLSDAAANQLVALSTPQLTSFANSLISKRLNEVRKLLPRTALVLGLDMRGRFEEFAHGYLPKDVHRHRADAVSFAAFLRMQVDLEPHWIADLAAYEAASLRAMERPLVILRSESPWYTLLQTNWNGAAPSKWGTIHVWLRLTPHQPPWHTFISFAPSRSRRVNRNEISSR